MAFPSLPLPPLDDSMEVSSSPAGNVHDDDIDIDFGDYYDNTGGVQLTDDEHMLEDGDPVRPPTATDEMMGDDEHVNAAPVHEEVMQDSDEAGQFDLADEELIDYDDDDDLQYQGQEPADTIFETAEPVAQDPTTVASTTGETQPQAVEPADGEIVRQSEPDVKSQEVLIEETTAIEFEETAQVDGTTLLASEDADKQLEEQEAQASNEQTDANVPAVDGEGKQDLYTVAEESKALEAVDDGEAADAKPAATVGGEAETTETISGRPIPQLPGTLDTTARHVSEGPPTPTDTGLHPMTVRYGEFALPLFKSRSQLDGLLKNDNLANVSLSDLIKTCRERLPVKTGEAVSDEHNLVLGFDSMGLVLVEGSPCASETSLQDVLEVYLLLHQNDGNDDVPPLFMTLTVQLKFSSHLQMFKQTALQGRGMSSFAAHEDADDYDDEAEQNEGAHDNEQTLVEDVNGHDEATAAGQDHAQGFTEDLAQGEHQEYEENNEYADDVDYSGQHEGQEYNEDTHYEEYDEHADEHAEYPDPEEETEGAAEDSVLAHEASESHAHTGDANGDNDPAALNSAAPVQADPENDGTDTAAEESRDELAAPDEEHEYSAEDSNFNEAYAAAHHDLSGEDPATGEDNADDELGLNLGAEDSYDPDLAYPEPEEDGEQQYDEAGEELAQPEDHAEGHADHVDNGDEGELQPQEDDDQFHTAFDLLDGEDQQHGPGDEANSNGHDQPAATAQNEEDNIIFDDDDEDDASNDVSAAAVNNNSPLGKRSFEEHADDDDLFDFGDDEPEQKKARSG